MSTAVVLGASMGGLLAARALAGLHDEVVVLDRDALPPGPDHRRGVPQGRHFHTLLPRGVQALDAMFPGLSERLVEEGSPRADFAGAHLVLGGHEFARADVGVPAVQVPRPVLERAVRERVADLPGVEVRTGCEAVGLVSERGRVTGARVVRDGVERVLAADLVVDATGRGGRAATWLGALGHPAPVEERIEVDAAYVSRLVRLTEPFPDHLVLVGPAPARPTGFALAKHGGDRWMLTAVGVGGVHPPVDERGHLEFVRRAAPPSVFRAIESASPLTEPLLHRFPTSLRRRYERLRDFPLGLLVFGDALCSFNPIYGQGMTVAALEAEALRRCLRAGEGDLAGRFFRAAARIVDPVWLLNALGDLALPQVAGHRSPSTRLLNRYVARVQRAAAHDPRVARMFIRVTGLLDPPTALFRPDVAARVAVGRSRRA
ncbi:NAD(P)/FAD-dependent oxidoreductase [Saccharothrix lopnurensis]|uniref:NAD(P)/FAD-dependent oxidoreductase n=1 Tax=Saccharothrix lopnurensis TaxID=1670621 RepID=A0ABW1P7S7_9PSEU